MIVCNELSWCLRRSLSAVLLASTLVLPSLLEAEEDSLIVSRGDAALYLSDLDARMNRMLDQDRAIHARRPDSLGGTVARLLLNRQLYMEAIELGLLDDENIKKDIQLAIEEVVSIHRLNHLLDEQLPDFNALAYEYYLTNRDAHVELGVVTVDHVLISFEDRDESDALAVAGEVRRLALKGEKFSNLVEQYSDDPGKIDNQGRYAVSVPGQFVPEFEAAAKALEQAGEVSDPVRTDYGYHILQLVEKTEDRQIPWQEVQMTLVEKARADYIATVRQNHISKLKALPEQVNEDVLIQLRSRYGGE